MARVKAENIHAEVQMGIFFLFIQAAHDLSFHRHWSSTMIFVNTKVFGIVESAFVTPV